jgi:hypothetical protein
MVQRLSLCVVSIDHDVGRFIDADEIPGAAALTHLQHCQWRSLTPYDAVFLPALAFKKNFHWLQTTKDLGCLGESDGLQFHSWRP